MASSPTFTSVPRIGVGSVSTANTARDGSGTIVDILTGATAGTKINEIVVKATADPADSIVTLFIYDGSVYRIFDEFDLGDPAAASTTVRSFREPRFYDNLVLPSASFKLAAAITVAPTSGAVLVLAFAGDMT